MVGMWGGIAGLAVASGPLIGGGITQALNWHWIFWVNVPIGVAAALGASLRLPESYGPRARFDVPALVLVTVGVGTLTWGVIQGGQDGWGTTQNLSGLLAGAALLAGFVWWENRAPEPMIPLGLFRRLSFSFAVTTQFFLSASIFSAAFLTSQFFQFGLSNSPLRTGVVFALDGYTTVRGSDCRRSLRPPRTTERWSPRCSTLTEISPPAQRSRAANGPPWQYRRRRRSLAHGRRSVSGAGERGWPSDGRRPGRETLRSLTCRGRQLDPTRHGEVYKTASATSLGRTWSVVVQS